MSALSDLARNRPIALSYVEQLLEYIASNVAAVVPPTRAAMVVPSDTQIQPFTSRQLVASGAGNIKVLMVGDTVPIVIAMAAGVPLLASVSQVFDTDTTATGIIAFY